MNEKALKLLQSGFYPVLLGNKREDLKRPILKRWRTAVYTPQQVAQWPARNNLGIRCGQQPNGRFLLVFDFDEESPRVFPTWLEQTEQLLSQRLVIVCSARGYHAYFFTITEKAGVTIAGRYGTEDGRLRLHRFIETIGPGKQIVTAGSLHPSGKRYRFFTNACYADIPTLTEETYQVMIALSSSFDQRPTPLPAWPAKRPKHHLPQLDGITNCLEYARLYIGGKEYRERNGDIRLLGHGGLLITSDGRGWYSFSNETGGGLAGLIAWHQQWRRVELEIEQSSTQRGKIG